MRERSGSHPQLACAAPPRIQAIVDRALSAGGDCRFSVSALGHPSKLSLVPRRETLDKCVLRVYNEAILIKGAFLWHALTSPFLILILKLLIISSLLSMIFLPLLALLSSAIALSVISVSGGSITPRTCSFERFQGCFPLLDTIETIGPTLKSMYPLRPNGFRVFWGKKIAIYANFSDDMQTLAY